MVTKVNEFVFSVNLLRRRSIIEDMKLGLSSRLRQITTGVAHRGLHDLSRPENSLAAFVQAIEHMIPFECDIHATKDDRLVVCHDSDLLRMTGKNGIIEELTFGQIREDYHLPDGSPIPELCEVFALNNGQVPMGLELKSHGGNEKQVASLAIPQINALPNAADCLIISFFPEVLRAAKAVGTSLPLGFLIGTEAMKKQYLPIYEEFDFLDVEVHYSLFPRFRRYRKKGGAIVTWTVKSGLTAAIAKRRSDCPTWEIVDSAKEKHKINRAVLKKFAPFMEGI